MIYDSFINAINEDKANALLESVEDRFEDYTITEATAIIVGEQEANWTRFMTGVGISELSSIMEGQDVIYEGARMQSFIKKAKGYFQMALNKLAEITKSFIAKVDQLFRTNDSFLKKYEKVLNNMSVPSDFEFKGYNFTNMKGPEYGNGAKTEVAGNLGTILANKDTDYSAEAAENAVFKGTAPSENSLSEKLKVYFYGGKKEKDKINININEQIGYLKETKNLKKNAKDSYTKAAKDVKEIIKKLDNAEKEFMKSDDKGEAKDSARMGTAFNVLISYWKKYASSLSQAHGAYMSALGARQHQAKAICTKLIIANGKAKGKADRKEIKDKMESYVDTDIFLGAVEFI